MKHEHISSEEFKKKIEEGGYVLIDTRTHEEFHSGHIKDAKHIDFHSPTFQMDLMQLDKDLKYLVYCRSGNRSGQAMNMMKFMNFKEVYNLSGGIIDWNENGFEIIKMNQNEN